MNSRPGRNVSTRAGCAYGFDDPANALAKLAFVADDGVGIDAHTRAFARRLDEKRESSDPAGGARPRR